MAFPAAEAAAMAVSGPTAIFTVGSGAATFAGYSVYQGMTGPTDPSIVKRFRTPNEYIDWLELAIGEVSTWLRPRDEINHKAPRDNTDSTSPREAAAYEKNLLKQGNNIHQFATEVSCPTSLTQMLHIPLRSSTPIDVRHTPTSI